MGTNCTPLVADLFLFCYERDYMLSLSVNNQTDVSRNVRFPTIWYVRPAKAQTSLRLRRAV